MSARERLKRLVKTVLPTPAVDAALLRFPSLYRSSLVSFETALHEQGGIGQLLASLDRVLGVPGDMVEFGCHRCGTTVHMAEHLRRRGVRKRIYALDSFSGFHPDELERERRSGLTDAPQGTFTRTRYEYVRRKLETLGYDEITVLPGYFEQTFPTLDGPFCLALVDCDLSESVRYAAESAWSRLSPGGHVLFDDYASERYLGTRGAVDTFVGAHVAEIAEHRHLERLYLVVRR